MKFLLGLIALISFPAWTATSNELLLQKVTSDNLSVQGLNSSVEGEKARRGHLGRSFLPHLVLEFGQERFQTGRYPQQGNPYGMLEARINLFRGGRDQLESEIRELSARIAEHNRSLGVREQLNKARKAQWQIIYNNGLIRILDEELKQNARIKAQAERRARSGVATRSDTLEFTIHNSELEEGIESLKHENLILKIGLAPLLGLASTEALRFEDTIAHEHDDRLLKSLFDPQKHSQVASLDAEYEVSQKQKSIHNRWWTPSLDIYGGHYLYTLRERDYLHQSARDDQVIGARVTFELFDGLRSSNQATVHSRVAEGRRLQARFLEKQTEAQYLMLKEDLLHTHEVMHYIEDRIKMSRDYLRLTLGEYDRGVKNSLEALTAMQRYFRYEKQYLEKKKEYQVIKADILSLRGE